LSEKLEDLFELLRRTQTSLGSLPQSLMSGKFTFPQKTSDAPFPGEEELSFKIVYSMTNSWKMQENKR